MLILLFSYSFCGSLLFVYMKKDYLPLSGNIAAAVSVAAAHHNADYTMHIQWAELRP